MPWENKADVLRHNKLAASNPKKARIWRKIANQALKNTGDDASAIRIANSSVKHMRGGGAATRGFSKGKVV